MLREPLAAFGKPLFPLVIIERLRRTTGTQVTFTANEPGTYHIHAVNNGADSVFVLTVSAAATPEPTAVPTPMPEPTHADSTPQ